MIVNTDRNATLPRRRQIIPEDGSAPFYATVNFADEPTEEGTLVNKEVLDQYLAASGITTGTSSAIALAQVGFVLTDGAPIRFRAHVIINGTCTLNVAGTGAKQIIKINGVSQLQIVQHAWCTVIYSQGLDAYILQSDVNINPTFQSATINGTLNMNNNYIENALFK